MDLMFSKLGIYNCVMGMSTHANTSGTGTTCHVGGLGDVYCHIFGFFFTLFWDHATPTM